MTNQETLTDVEWSILNALREAKALGVEAVAKATKANQSQIVAAVPRLVERQLIAVSARDFEEVIRDAGADGLVRAGLPERRIAEELNRAGGEMSMDELVAWADQSRIAINEALRWGQTRGWLRKVEDAAAPVTPEPDEKQARKKWKVVLTEDGRSGLGGDQDDERALKQPSTDRLLIDQLVDSGLDRNRLRKLLGNREGVAKIKKRTERILALTDTGAAVLEEGAQVKVEQTSLTADDLQSGAWREIVLRQYDVTLPARTIYPAKAHPLRRIMEETRRAFLEMGFTEVMSPMVESAFWNFDALYQPQDHPAREMQDTFYMAEPNRLELPDAAVVERVRRTHEDGWETGSQGWGYRWEPEQARRVVLRTHTTAATIRALARHPNPPLKVFCVGWTFRNETISYKHLPVFHQVDGVIIDKEASLSTLLGTLAEFYRKMGFERVKFKPAFYPYTEPSCDVVVYMKSRERWIEMGGSGVFRPEVTEPLGCRYPVLAWGLGIERLAMLRLGFDDIRELYRCSMDRMEEVPLCR